MNPSANADYVRARCQCCHAYTFDLVAEICRSCGAVPLAPLDDVWHCTDLCDHAAGQFMCEHFDGHDVPTCPHCGHKGGGRFSDHERAWRCIRCGAAVPYRAMNRQDASHPENQQQLPAAPLGSERFIPPPADRLFREDSRPPWYRLLLQRLGFDGSSDG